MHSVNGFVRKGTTMLTFHHRAAKHRYMCITRKGVGVIVHPQTDHSSGEPLKPSTESPARERATGPSLVNRETISDNLLGCSTVRRTSAAYEYQGGGKLSKLRVNSEGPLKMEMLVALKWRFRIQTRVRCGRRAREIDINEAIRRVHLLTRIPLRFKNADSPAASSESSDSSAIIIRDA